MVIAFLDALDVHHAGAVDALETHRDEHLVIPASAYAEVLVHPYRRGAAAVAEVEGAVAALPIRVAPVDAGVARRAAQLRSRRLGLTLGDALVLASGDELAAGRVLATDDDWPKVSERAQLL